MRREVVHWIAVSHEHVADVELEAHGSWIEALDEHVVRHRAVDRLHVIGLVVEREPDSGAPRGGAGRVEPVRPLLPRVERMLGLVGKARHHQILVTE